MSNANDRALYRDVVQEEERDIWTLTIAVLLYYITHGGHAGHACAVSASKETERFE